MQIFQSLIQPTNSADWATIMKISIFLYVTSYSLAACTNISEKFMAASLFCSEGEGWMYPTILVPLHQTTKGHMPDH